MLLLRVSVPPRKALGVFSGRRLLGVAASVLLLLLFLQPAEAQIAKGVVFLDSLTFDKVLAIFPYVLVKFDKSYPSGAAEDAFKEFAKRSVPQKKLLVTAVSITSYGDNKNEDLAQRFALKSEDFPQFRLFSYGQTSTAAIYSGEVTVDGLISFVRKNAGLYIGLPGCLEEFDKIAALTRRVSSTNVSPHVSEARKLRAELADAKDIQSADVYIKILELTASRGARFCTNEVNRVKKVLAGKVAEEKRKELEIRLNILQSFVADSDDDNQIGDGRDEL